MPESSITMPAPRKRSFVVAYARANPASAILAGATLVTAVAFGTLWGGFPEEMAAGPITTGQLAYWWTPVTALMIPDSAVELVLTAVLSLTAMAYAERKLGSWTTVLVFFAGGAVSVLLGVGLETLAAAWGESWALLAQIDLVLDPPIGIVAVVLAASALAPMLWRRRIRVIGFSLLLMFALYAGDSDSAYRLIAGVVGLLVGLMLPRGGITGAWRRSSIRETRTLIAAIVAVTGLGPLIVLLSGADRGPLAIVVWGFSQVDPDEVFARCAEDFSARCDTDIALALTNGAGSFVLSLVPLVLSLIAAWGLRTGRRSAWILGLAVGIGVAVLTAVGLGTADLLDPAVAAGLDAEFVVSAGAATLVPITVVMLLLATARRFQVGAPRGAAIRFTLTVLVALMVLMVTYAAISVLSADDFPSSPGEPIADMLRLFVPVGFLGGLPFVAPPVAGLGLFAFQWLGVVFWAVFIVAMLLLYRATATGRTSVEEERFRALLKKGGGGTLGFMGTWPGNDYWFSEDGEAAVAYRVINGVALTMSDPVCAAGRDEETIRAFVDHCDAQGWATVFYSFHDRYLPVFESFGWQHMSVGEETVIDLPDLEIAGKPWQKVRQALNRGTREGMTTVWSTWAALPPALAAQIEAISEEWVSEKELPEMGFTLGGMDELKDDDVYLYLAVDPQGGVQAITSWLPSWTDGRVSGWTIDFMRRGDDSMNGIMEFIIASAALRMKEEGAEVLSLSGAPLAEKPLADGEEPPEPNVMTRLLSWLGGVLEPAYGFSSLFKFKSKFNPRYDTIHMAYADAAQLPAIGTAIGKAYLPEVSPREYVALAKTLTGVGRA